MSEEILRELKEVKEDIRLVKDAIYVGNGQPSLMSRIQTVETILVAIKRLLWLFIASLLALCVTYIFQIHV